MKGNKMENYKFNRVVKLDKSNRYDVICKENKHIDNDLNKQLNRFKSTLNRGRINAGEQGESK